MACLALVVACGGEDGPGESSDADLPEFSGESEVMAEVGTDGASLLLGKEVSLRIPAGALEKPVDVRVTRVEVGDLEAREPEEMRASDLVRFEPHGQKFRMPVEIEVRVTRDEASDAELSMARLDDEQDRDWERVRDTRVLQPADDAELEGLSEAQRERRGSRRVQARTMRFSIYTAIVAPDTGGEDGGTSGGDNDGGSSGGEDGGTSGAMMGGTSAGEATFGALPWDLRSCPDGGCRFPVGEAPQDGVWLDCRYQGDPTGFDPDTFDFEAACVDREAFDPTGYNTFIHDGGKYDGYELECSGYNVGVVDETRYALAGCYGTEHEVFFEPFVVDSDGSMYTYYYDGCDGICTPGLYVEVLEPRDTSALFETCMGAERQLDEQPCEEDVAFSLAFGPGAVGTVPSVLADRFWFDCGDTVYSDAPTDAELTAACADLVAGTASYDSGLRLTQDGVFEQLYSGAGGWDGLCGSYMIGGDDSSLRLFYCEEGDNGWAYAATITPTYRVRTIDSVDYLLLDWGDGTSVHVDSAMVDGPTPPAPGFCGDSDAVTCIVE